MARCREFQGLRIQLALCVLQQCILCPLPWRMFTPLHQEVDDEASGPKVLHTISFLVRNNFTRLASNAMV